MLSKKKHFKKTFYPYLIVILLSGSLVDSVWSQDVNRLDENYGFQNYEFGDLKQDYPNCSFETVKDGGAEKCIKKRSHSIGEIESNKVHLWFIDSQLMRVDIYFDIKERSELSTAVHAIFGDNYHLRDKPGMNNRTLIWEANKVSLHFASFYNYEHILTDADSYSKLKFMVNDFDEKLEKQQQEQYSPSDF